MQCLPASLATSMAKTILIRPKCLCVGAVAMVAFDFKQYPSSFANKMSRSNNLYQLTKKHIVSFYLFCN